MCVEKTRGYEKNNKKKLMNAVVGWGRPVYVGEENQPLLSKAGITTAPVSATPAVQQKATPAKPAAFKPFKVGASGSSVKRVQQRLGVSADGKFGPGTEKAVKEFQKKNALKETGIVDQATYKKIIGE
jgi:peptidoglycan hydrolase-like protein with peptidoglycan-binding domain